MQLPRLPDDPPQRGSRSLTEGQAASSSVASTPSGERASTPAGPADLEQKFEEDFSQHIKTRNRTQRLQLGAVGAGIGGCIGVAASPLVLPGLCFAALVGGASAYQAAKSWGRKELARHRGGSADEGALENPSFRRLKYLVKWGHLQLLEYEDSPAETQCAVLDEVVRAFSPWVQKLYLLRAKGCAKEDDAEAWEVFLHLAPLYYLLQRRASVEAVVKCGDAVLLRVESGQVDAICAERVSVSFPTILETVSALDRLSPAMHAQLVKEQSGSKRRGVFSENRANRRQRLQRMVAALRRVLERPGVQEAVAHHGQAVSEEEEFADGAARSPVRVGDVRLEATDGECPASPSRSPRTVQIVVPPEGIEDEHVGAEQEDSQYFSVSEESEEEHPSSSSSKPAAGSKAPGLGDADFRKRLEAFPRGDSDHTWTSFDAGQFDVRSESYLVNRMKMPSEEAMFEIVNVDFQLVGPNGPVWRATEHKDFYPAHHRRTGDKRFLLVQNWVFPPFQCVLTGALDPDAPWLRRGPAGSPQARLWHKFLEMDNEGRRDIFKVICSVEDGPWLVKRALPKKPVLIGKKLGMTTHYVPDDYLEIVMDVAAGRGQQVAVGIVCGALRRLQLAFSAVLEAREEEELPEQILFCASMLHLDPAQLFSPEAS